MAGNTVIRSVLGGTLPLAGQAMYATLKPHWASTMLGLMQVAIIPIPVLFYRYGHNIRMKSILIRRMQEDKEKLESKRTSGTRLAKKEKEEDEMGKTYSKIAQP